MHESVTSSQTEQANSSYSSGILSDHYVPLKLGTALILRIHPISLCLSHLRASTEEAPVDQKTFEGAGSVIAKQTSW